MKRLVYNIFMGLVNVMLAVWWLYRDDPIWACLAAFTAGIFLTLVAFTLDRMIERRKEIS